MDQFRGSGVTAFRFVDDLLLGAKRVIATMMEAFTTERVGEWAKWDATGRINVKGYFILGFPTETEDEIHQTVRLVRDLWAIAGSQPGTFRASAFEYRPYPGTPDWARLMNTGRYTADQLLNYTAVDLTSSGEEAAMRERDEFNFSVNIQLSEASVDHVRRTLIALSREQYERKVSA
ncbi:hypothetical protein [Haloechinothrix sp. LS1_15]|uniref:hypothetical protein n=1 Tax=Haloechinothrix sp. LS1_15 TaxID=2652248 RepID=UPI00294B7337|nr:hypothetical protein [Haloechinothrix sp. LS1_15]